MTLLEATHMPLTGSWLCQNCQSVGNNPHQCPACADRTALVSLERVLNRSSEDGE